MNLLATRKRGGIVYAGDISMCAETRMPNCDIYETGQEPDYTIDEIARVEYLKDGGVRLYLSSEWGGGQRVEYSVRVTTPEKLMEFSRALTRIAAEAHDITQSQIMVGELTH